MLFKYGVSGLVILGKLSNNMGRVVLDYGASCLGLSFRVPDRGHPKKMDKNTYSLKPMHQENTH